MNTKKILSFIDLFAGIGGFHLALQKLNFQCVFASEIDKYAREVYKRNFKIQDEFFNSDIKNITPNNIPNHDVLCAGFPCQPFSQSGKKRGFLDTEEGGRGNLFFYIANILKTKKPKAFILENVRYLVGHDNGKTFETICNILEHDLGYKIFYKIIKASDFGRPQHRPRIYIVGFNPELIDCNKPFNFPKPLPLTMTMSDVWGGKCDRDIGYTLRVGGKGSPIGDRRNWDGYIVDGKIVRLGPIQAKKMMGFPDDFVLSESRTQAMKQLGNSVCVDVVYHIGMEVKKYLEQ